MPNLARLAARYAGAGVVGFGLSNDERRGDTAAFAPAFRIAREAGLAAVPHGGELRGADAVAREARASGEAGAEGGAFGYADADTSEFRAIPT